MTNQEIKDHVQAVINMLIDLKEQSEGASRGDYADTIQNSIDALSIALARVDNQGQYLTIVCKIIEYALSDNVNQERIRSYAELLADNFDKSDEKLKATCIRNVLSGKKGNIISSSEVTLD